MLASLLVVAAMLAGDAQAAPQEQEGDPTARSQARELLLAGNALIAQGDFAGALRRYRAAYELFQSPNLLLNIGTSLRHLGRDAAAATAYEQYVAHPAAEPDVVLTVRKLLSEIDALTGRLTIVLNVEDARVHVDGRLLPDRAARITVRVDPGEHTVVAEKEGRATAVQTVVVDAGQQETIAIDLRSPSLQPTSDGRPQRILAYGMGGIALAGLGVGAVFGGLFLASKAEADDHCDALRCDSDGADAVAEAQDRGLVANVAFVTSGVLAAGAVVVFLTAPTNDDDPAPAAIGLRVEPCQLRLEARW
ncbi:MAG: PEGA domain-containing protein [Deltaproteobacteria bacterium]|nr:PEGA domain-containing protein [Deltaproteobacteria bacterium]